MATALAICLIAPIASADVTIDRTTKYQSIEGFGFFGAADAWWNQATVFNATWSQMVIDDLVSPCGETKDAQWNVQKPVVQSLYAAANASKVSLKTVLTVWLLSADYKPILLYCGDHEQFGGTLGDRQVRQPTYPGPRHGGGASRRSGPRRCAHVVCLFHEDITDSLPQIPLLQMNRG